MARKAKDATPAGPFRRAAIELEPDLYELALAHAQRRNLTLAEFLARLIETAVRDDLVGTVLGDEEETQG